MDQVKFYFDPLCPWCYQTSRWAKRLSELGEINLDWGVFSLEVVNLEEGKDPDELEARSGPALRTAIAIRDSEGSRAIGKFYSALGARVWEQSPPEPHGTDTVRAALAAADLDPSLCDKAVADRSTWHDVLEEHRALVERTRSFGVPTIVLDGGTGPAFFGPVVSELPTDDDAVELWRHVSWLTRYGNFSELKRQRLRRPDLPAVEWYRQQREKERQASAT
jgi:protein-disulfide isomerase-like protein with CxxC motif